MTMQKKLLTIAFLLYFSMVVAQTPTSNNITFDASLQQLAERMMKGKQGSIVAIDPATGELKCMVSASHSGDSITRAVSVAYSPGSTFKVAQALAQLSEGTLTPTITYSCSRGFTQGGIHIGCHAHSSPRAVVAALGTSCNAFFCKSFMSMLNSTRYKSRAEAINRWHQYMTSYGLGCHLGTDIGNENTGVMPDNKYLTKLHGQWTSQTIMWMGMGQGEVTVTPLQLCNLAAIVANRGWYITPHMYYHDTDSTFLRHNHALGTPQAYQLVVQGMRSAVVSGTCSEINRGSYTICGKTGTAENDGDDHSLFIGFAPMDSPRIAVAVIIDNGGFGADMAAPMASLIIEQALTGKLREYSQYQVKLWENETVAPCDPLSNKK